MFCAFAKVVGWEWLYNCVRHTCLGDRDWGVQGAAVREAVTEAEVGEKKINSYSECSNGWGDEYSVWDSLEEWP